MNKIAIILPCGPWLKYKSVEKIRTWKYVLKNLGNGFDYLAVDCIKLDGKRIGLWKPLEEKNILKKIIQKRLDEYPSWETFTDQKMKELIESIKEKIHYYRLNKYRKIIVYVNVKGYYIALKKAFDDLKIKNVVFINMRFSPYGFFKRSNLEKLKKTVEKY